MTKIRAHKTRVHRVLHWYTEEVTRELLGKADLRTIKGRYVAEEALKRVQLRQITAEPQVEEWKFPLKLHIVEQDHILPILNVVVDPEWERDNLLYLDFDK